MMIIRFASAPAPWLLAIFAADAFAAFARRLRYAILSL